MNGLIQSHKIGDIIECPYVTPPVPEEKQFPVGSQVLFLDEEDLETVLATGVCLETNETAATVELRWFITHD